MLNLTAKALADHIEDAPDDVTDYLVALCRDVSEQHRDALSFSEAGRAWFKQLYVLQERLRDDLPKVN